MSRTYAEKLRDPRWQKKRLEVMQRAEFACEWCAAKDKTLNVHHTIYRRGADPWDYADSELLCICEICHSLHHHWVERLNEAIAEIGPGGLEQLVGFAEAMTACDYVFTDREGLPPRSWSISSHEQAWGFYARLRARGPAEQIGALLEMRDLTHGDVFAIAAQEVPPTELAERAKREGT